jgi:hypothetical protein
MSEDKKFESCNRDAKVPNLQKEDVIVWRFQSHIMQAGEQYERINRDTCSCWLAEVKVKGQRYDGVAMSTALSLVSAGASTSPGTEHAEVQLTLFELQWYIRWLFFDFFIAAWI